MALTTQPTLKDIINGVPQSFETLLALLGYKQPESATNDYNVAIPGTGLTRDNLVGNHLIRANMTAKGQGFYGNINGTSNPDYPAITELSIGVGVPKDYRYIPGLNPSVAPLQLPGHQNYYDAPSVVPGLNASQLKDISEENITDAIYSLAEKHAADRQWHGKPVFANSNDIAEKYPNSLIDRLRELSSK